MTLNLERSLLIQKRVNEGLTDTYNRKRSVNFVSIHYSKSGIYSKVEIPVSYYRGFLSNTVVGEEFLWASFLAK